CRSSAYRSYRFSPEGVEVSQFSRAPGFASSPAFAAARRAFAPGVPTAAVGFAEFVAPSVDLRCFAAAFVVAGLAVVRRAGAPDLAECATAPTPAGAFAPAADSRW